jgi:hypothetical protein
MKQSTIVVGLARRLSGIAARPGSRFSSLDPTMLKQLPREELGAHADGVADDTARMLASPFKVQQTAN